MKIQPGDKFTVSPEYYKKVWEGESRLANKVFVCTRNDYNCIYARFANDAEWDTWLPGQYCIKIEESIIL